MNRRQKIAIDLTPLTHNSGIGGAKSLALELIRNLRGEKSIFDYVLLTSEDSHEELASLDADNVARVCVKPTAPQTAGPKLSQRLHLLVDAFLPAALGKLVKRLYRRAKARSGDDTLLAALGVDLLLCPFTGPLYHTPGIPTVSVVHDLQFLVYPEYFSKLERLYLEEHFREACELSSHLISGSIYAKQTILENSGLQPEDITVVYDSIHSRLADGTIPAPDMLEPLGLTENGYLFFPARYWPHKNHVRALEGFKRFLGDTPTETKLVFSGISPEGQQELQQHIERLGLGSAVVVLGWMAEEELAGLFKYCWALLFPSLHEGFGIPVVEAFQFGKPVLCSNVTSLPEVAGEAALYFDPNSSAAIAAAITKLAENPQLAADLIQKGRARLASFPNSREIARQYEAVIAEVLDES